MRPNLYPLVTYDRKWPDDLAAENCKALPVLSFAKIAQQENGEPSLVCDPKPIGQAS